MGGGGTDGNDTLTSTTGADFLRGRGGDDIFNDGDTLRSTGVDFFRGNKGNDTFSTQYGRDMVLGGKGNDTINSRSDGGEPTIAQDPTMSPYNPGQPFSADRTDDVLRGGRGSDNFNFRLDLDARPDIAQKHVDANGVIDWEGVAGENGGVHLHWVNGIGTDTITDFSKAEGDRISIEGHTAAITLTYQDLNKDGREESIISIRSDQGGAGSHNGDSLGQIVVYGDRVENGDVAVDAEVHHGAYVTINDLMIA
jgi:Ca2+-binding RTX toxin-like protein